MIRAYVLGKPPIRLGIEYDHRLITATIIQSFNNGAVLLIREGTHR